MYTIGQVSEMFHIPVSTLRYYVKKTYVEYLLDLFLYESEEEQKAWIAEHTAEILYLIHI